ncbi:MAG: ABC transporter substrate-binding protein [Alphaproteobacteria bacterium]|nr:ABC transporter substrate-binding protein [Alphaproteobacteria bacterium]
MRTPRSLSRLGRRTTLGLLGASAGAGLTAPFIRPSFAEPAWPEQTTIPDILKGSGEVRIATFGGTMQETQQKAYFEPFEKISGIKVRAFPGSDPTKIKAMVETGNVEWDLAQLSRGSIMNLQKRGDYFEKIDYDLVDAGVDKAYRFEYGLEMLVWAQVLGYRTDAFKGAKPSGWADFWDTKKFPGDRAMYGTGSGGWPELEFALLAAGVPADKLYPLDLDKGFASYDKIKKDIVKWWDTGAVPVQMLTDREVTMTTVWNGRMAALQAAGVPAAISWSQGLLKRDAWGIPKGAKNKLNAQKFVAYSTMAIPQARVSLGIPYGSVNDASNEYIPPERLEILPSAPKIKAQLVTYNYDWWIDNRDTVVNRFNKWLLG